MHDIKYIRSHPEAFDAAMQRRGLSPQSADILKADEEERALKTEAQELQSQRNSLSKQIGMAMKNGEDPAPIKKQVEDINTRLKQLETGEGGKVAEMLAALPNIMDEDVPDGADENDNKEVRSHGDKKEFSFKPKEHFDLGEQLGLMSFEDAAKMSGARFVVLKGALARLERAMASFFLDTLTEEFGYQETIPPFLVRDNALFGTAQLPKFADQQFRTEEGFWLIPTSEVPLTNLSADMIIDDDQLPIRRTAYTPCFRSEAGAAGKDTRGMIRQHQFTKVEMVSVTHPDHSEDEHERMTGCAETLLQKLGLHYRVMLLCSGDTGFGARKTYDIEVWLPGQGAYREISSCSNCGDFQARRMKARFRVKGEKDTRFVHTLNGSGLPIGRTMVAILENYQNEDGSITVPEVLRSYMGGLETIK